MPFKSDAKKNGNHRSLTFEGHFAVFQKNNCSPSFKMLTLGPWFHIDWWVPVYFFIRFYIQFSKGRQLSLECQMLTNGIWLGIQFCPLALPTIFLKIFVPLYENMKYDEIMRVGQKKILLRTVNIIFSILSTIFYI